MTQEKKAERLPLGPALEFLDKPTEGTIENAVERLLASSNAEEMEAARRTLDRLAALLAEEVEPHDE